MLKLGWFNKGFIIFDYERMQKMIVHFEDKIGIRITFDCSEMDKRRSYGEQFVREIEVERKTNERLCSILDSLYDNYLLLQEKNGFNSVSETNEANGYTTQCWLSLPTRGNCTELIYPSDDTSLLSGKILFGLLKIGEDGYLLRLHRTVKNFDKENVLIGWDETRISGGYNVFNEAFSKVLSMPLTRCDIIDEDFNDYVNNREWYYKKHLDKCDMYIRMNIQSLYSELSDLKCHSEGAPRETNLLNGIGYAWEAINRLEEVIENKNGFLEQEKGYALSLLDKK